MTQALDIKLGGHAVSREELDRLVVEIIAHVRDNPELREELAGVLLHVGVDVDGFETLTEEEIEERLAWVCKLTKNRPHLWMDFGDETDPYLTADGARFVGTAARVNVGAPAFLPPEDSEEDDPNGDRILVYTVQVSGTFRDQHGAERSYTAPGIAPTDMPQLVARRAKANGKFGRGEAIVFTKDMALARAMTRLVTQILGVPGITWDDLRRHGIDRDKVRQKDNGGGGGGSRGNGGGGGGRNAGPSVRIPTRTGRSADGYVWDVYLNRILPGTETWKLLGPCTKDLFGGYWKKDDINNASPEQLERLADEISKRFGDPRLDPPPGGEQQPLPNTAATGGNGNSAAQKAAAGPSATAEQTNELKRLATALNLSVDAKKALLARHGGSLGSGFTEEAVTKAIAELAAWHRFEQDASSLSLNQAGKEAVLLRAGWQGAGQPTTQFETACAELTKRLGGEPPEPAEAGAGAAPVSDDDIPF
jgi:hypothetical protein